MSAKVSNVKPIEARLTDKQIIEESKKGLRAKQTTIETPSKNTQSNEVKTKEEWKAINKENRIKQSERDIANIDDNMKARLLESRIKSYEEAVRNYEKNNTPLTKRQMNSELKFVKELDKNFTGEKGVAIPIENKNIKKDDLYNAWSE